MSTSLAGVQKYLLEMDEMNGGAVYGLTLKLYDMESMWYQL
jgi:hypothetical protein